MGELIIPLDNLDKNLIEDAAKRIGAKPSEFITTIDDKDYIYYYKFYGIINELIMELDRLQNEDKEIDAWDLWRASNQW